MCHPLTAVLSYTWAAVLTAVLAFSWADVSKAAVCQCHPLTAALSYSWVAVLTADVAYYGTAVLKAVVRYLLTAALSFLSSAEAAVLKAVVCHLLTAVVTDPWVDVLTTVETYALATASKTTVHDLLTADLTAAVTAFVKASYLFHLS